MRNGPHKLKNKLPDFLIILIHSQIFLVEQFIKVFWFRNITRNIKISVGDGCMKHAISSRKEALLIQRSLICSKIADYSVPILNVCSSCIPLLRLQNLTFLSIYDMKKVRECITHMVFRTNICLYKSGTTAPLLGKHSIIFLLFLFVFLFPY